MARKNPRNTRRKIVTAAWKLFYEQGYDRTTVDQIILESGTSKGSFYHYFSGKDALLSSLSSLFDDKYEELMQEIDPDMNSFDKLMFLNRELFQMIEDTVSVELTSRMYATQLTTTGEKHLLDQGRTYYKLLRKISQEGQQRGEIAIGSGGIFGNGLFGGGYYSVPNAHNDFIFSWIGNVTGFVGCCVVLGVLFAIVIKTFLTGARSEDLLGTFICAGIGGALMAQIAVNVGMNLRVLPVIGVTLPFYSAGGSSVMMLYICVGLVLSVYIHNTKKLFG